jgi:hypothetical protein
MWAPDLTFLAIGMALVMRMGRGGGANRGGGLDEIFFLMGRRLSGFSRIFRRAT